jgi:hypothetical protein
MHADPSEFESYLRAAIRDAGYATPTQFARDADLDPSVVLRWLGGSQRPTVRSLEKVAPLLGRSTAEMVRAAYPDRLGHAGGAARLHDLALLVDQLLAEDSPLSAEDRTSLENVLRTLLTPYRSQLRARRARKRSTDQDLPRANDG